MCLKYGFTPLCDAADMGRTEVIAILLDNKADIMAVNQVIMARDIFLLPVKTVWII